MTREELRLFVRLFGGLHRAAPLLDLSPLELRRAMRGTVPPSLDRHAKAALLADLNRRQQETDTP